MESDIALQFDCADVEFACRNEYRSTPILCTGVDRSLHCAGIERCSVSLCSVITDVIDAGSQIVGGGFRGLRCQTCLVEQSSTKRGCHDRYGQLRQPLTSSKQVAIKFVHRLN